MRARLARIGVLLAAAAFLGYWALLVYCEVWRPTPLGLRLSFDAGRIVVVDTVPGGPAARAGLRAGDRLAAFEGHSIDGRMDWMAVEANLEIGQATQLSVERGGAVFAASMTIEPSSWQSWRSQEGPDAAGVARDAAGDDAARADGRHQTLARFDGACRRRLSRHHRRVHARAPVSVCVGLARAAPARAPAAVDPVHEQRGDCRVGILVLRDLSARALSARASRGARSGCRSCPASSVRPSSATTPSCWANPLRRCHRGSRAWSCSASGTSSPVWR